MNNNSISIFLHDMDNSIQSIIVRPSDSLRILDEQITTKGQRVLFCNGMILMPAFSFQYLNIHDNDHIFVIRPKESKMKAVQAPQKHRMNKDHHSLTMSQQLKRITDNASYHDRSLNLLGSSSILHEASRLADLSKAQFDSNLLTHYYNLQQKSEDNIQRAKPKEVSQIILQPPTSPSSEALPLLWGLM
ncbi:hypothetical protein M9Y10_027377 [Tritrichomonas musculus]|uniref:Ubiquitin-like domain-containing protein n=1 Tax=Tritrichomonas musculus TaxID=1915356 RepID=A0ABR2H4L8_9EUKA